MQTCDAYYAGGEKHSCWLSHARAQRCLHEQVFLFGSAVLTPCFCVAEARLPVVPHGHHLHRVGRDRALLHTGRYVRRHQGLTWTLRVCFTLDASCVACVRGRGRYVHWTVQGGRGCCVCDTHGPFDLLVRRPVRLHASMRSVCAHVCGHNPAELTQLHQTSTETQRVAFPVLNKSTKKSQLSR